MFMDPLRMYYFLYLNCVSGIRNLSDISLNIILRLFNRIWIERKLLSIWKHGVIVPVAKPGKDQSNPINYRP